MQNSHDIKTGQSTTGPGQITRTINWVLAALTVVMTVSFFLTMTLARSFVREPLGETAIRKGTALAFLCLAVFFTINVIFTFGKAGKSPSRDGKAES